MPQQVALLIFTGFVVALIARDVRRRPSVSAASWLVLTWLVILGSRNVGQWFESSSTVAGTDLYLDGSPIDRAVFLVLILAGCVVLWLRRVPFGRILYENRWLFAFYAYFLVSVFWSDYPFVAFKRWFKDFGCVIMVLVVITERDPVEAIKAVFLRSAYLLVPASALFIKYYPDLGRTYSGYNRSDLMYAGVAANKNGLGAMLLVCTVFLVWNLVARRTVETQLGGRFRWIDAALVLAITLWLLVIANSLTSLVCAVLGVSILFWTGMPAVKRTLRFVHWYGIAMVSLWAVLEAVFGITEIVVLSLGRDMTLTSRTGIWEIVLAQDINPLIGAGFGSFWLGDRMARLWAAVGGHIVQSHNGYLETYLNGGFFGMFFLVVMLLSGFRKIKASLVAGENFARVRLAFWLVAIVYNYSEAAFGQLGILWMVTLLVIAEGPSGCPSVSSPVIAAFVPPRAVPVSLSKRPPRPSVDPKRWATSRPLTPSSQPRRYQ